MAGICEALLRRRLHDIDATPAMDSEQLLQGQLGSRNFTNGCRLYGLCRVKAVDAQL